MIHKYYIFDSELVMHPDGKSGSFGTIIVNGTVYHVTQDRKKGQTFVNNEKIGSTFSYFQYDVIDYIAKHQQMSAWQRTQYGHDFRITVVKDESAKYCVDSIILYVYRTEDGTCWRYYKNDEYFEVRIWSPWYPADVVPSLVHFTQWITSTIFIEHSNVE